MPVACSSSALTGQSGSVYYTPAATKFCLLAADFPSGSGVITVPTEHDFRVGDPVIFTPTGTASLDSGITASTSYTVSAITTTTITIVTTSTGAAVTLAGDGTDGTGHVEIEYAPFGAICDITAWSLNIEREELEVTTLPCGLGVSGGKYAAFRRTQAGYASASGSMTLLFTDNNVSLGQRMLDNIMLRDQNGAQVRLFINTKSDGAATPEPDLATSTYIEGAISMTSCNTSVNPDDPTEAEVSFSVKDITHLFKVAI